MAQTIDLSGNDLLVGEIYYGASTPGSTSSNKLASTELAFIDGVTAGTATASKAVVLGASKEIATITTATITNLTSTTITPTTIAGAVNLSGAPTVTGALTPTGGIVAGGGFSAAPRMIHTGDEPAIATTSGSDATPVITEVYIAECFIPCNMTVTGVAAFNGSVASGNYKVGLANSAGTVVATSASTAMSGTDAYQRVAFTGTYAAVGPATYYVLQFIDNTTARYNTHTVGNFGASKQTGQTYATGFTTITPPTTFTTALGPMASLY